MMRAIGEVQAAPVIADLDTGFGNAINVAYAVPRYAAAGVAAGHRRAIASDDRSTVELPVCRVASPKLGYAATTISVNSPIEDLFPYSCASALSLIESFER